MTHRILPPLVLILLSTSLAGCAAVDRFIPERWHRSAPQEGTVRGALLKQEGRVVGANRVSAARLDETTVEEKKAALSAAPTTGERLLGSAAVSLGSPVEQGFWLRSPLVILPGKGRVETAGGKSVAVDLLPGASGTQLSLAAYRALGFALTDLPQVKVFGP